AQPLLQLRPATRTWDRARSILHHRTLTESLLQPELGAKSIADESRAPAVLPATRAPRRPAAKSRPPVRELPTISRRARASRGCRPESPAIAPAASPRSTAVSSDPLRGTREPGPPARAGWAARCATTVRAEGCARART